MADLTTKMKSVKRYFEEKNLEKKNLFYFSPSAQTMNPKNSKLVPQHHHRTHAILEDHPFISFSQKNDKFFTVKLDDLNSENQQVLEEIQKKKELKKLIIEDLEEPTEKSDFINLKFGKKYFFSKLYNAGPIGVKNEQFPNSDTNRNSTQRNSSSNTSNENYNLTLSTRLSSVEEEKLKKEKCIKIMDLPKKMEENEKSANSKYSNNMPSSTVKKKKNLLERILSESNAPEAKKQSKDFYHEFEIERKVKEMEKEINSLKDVNQNFTYEINELKKMNELLEEKNKELVQKNVTFEKRLNETNEFIIASMKEILNGKMLVK